MTETNEPDPGSEPTQPLPYVRPEFQHPPGEYAMRGMEHPTMSLPPPPPPHRHRKPHFTSAVPKWLRLLLIGLGVLTLLCCIGVVATAFSNDDGGKDHVDRAVQTPPATSAAPRSTPARPPTTKAAPPPKPKPAPVVTYATLTERQWRLVVKTPNGYVGKYYVVYGVVRQFDAATGPDGFLADVEWKNMSADYEYQTNVALVGDAAKLSHVLQGDEFRANVMVLGPYSYDTQIGGNTTVPMLQINAIKVIG